MHFLEEQLAYPSEITDYLFLSGVASLDNLELLKELGITKVISVMPNPPLLDASMKQLIIPIEDSSSVDISGYFPEVFNFISSAKLAGTKILVHCQQGISRSASFVIAWLMHEAFLAKNDINFATTLLQVRKIRSVVAPNQGFEIQLRALERSLRRMLIETRVLSLMDLPSDMHGLYLSFLGPKDKVILSRVCRFFNVTVKKDTFWRKHLAEQVPFTDGDYQLLEKKNIPLKKVYLSCRIPKPKSPVAHYPGYVIGTLGNLALAREYLDANPQDLSLIIMGATFNNQKALIEDLKNDHDILKVDPKNHTNFLSYAAASDNVDLLKFADTCNPKPNWKIKTKSGDNLLFVAAHSGSYNAFVFLFEQNIIDPIETNIAGDNLLLRVSQSGCDKIAEYIKKYRPAIDPKHSNNSKLTPYNLAVSTQKQSLVAIYESWPEATAEKTSNDDLNSVSEDCGYKANSL